MANWPQIWNSDPLPCHKWLLIDSSALEQKLEITNAALIQRTGCLETELALLVFSEGRYSIKARQGSILINLDVLKTVITPEGLIFEESQSQQGLQAQFITNLKELFSEAEELEPPIPFEVKAVQCCLETLSESYSNEIQMIHQDIMGSTTTHNFKRLKELNTGLDSCGVRLNKMRKLVTKLMKKDNRLSKYFYGRNIRFSDMPEILKSVLRDVEREITKVSHLKNEIAGAEKMKKERKRRKLGYQFVMMMLGGLPLGGCIFAGLVLILPTNSLSVVLATVTTLSFVAAVCFLLAESLH